MPSRALCRVLFVDDDEDTVEMLNLLLKPYEIQVTYARSASEASRMIKAECFDLYLLDAWMPQIDGFEFCRQLRDVDAITPILFYTGAANDTDKQKGIAAGASAYVIKPDVEGLIETIVDLLAKARANDVAPYWAHKPRFPGGNGGAYPSFSVADLDH